MLKTEVGGRGQIDGKDKDGTELKHIEQTSQLKLDNCMLEKKKEGE